MATETHEFQAETTALLNLVINSLYTNKDVFLRELISNASDALDRLRFEAITSPELLQDGHQYEIRLEVDSIKRTLTIQDSGIGMSRDEVVANIGTIAKSGTRELLQQAAKGANSEILNKLIGQFGVGFYSAFMVADKVELVTRRSGEPTATRWESDGGGTFEISETVRESNGTSITLNLKEADLESGIGDYSDTGLLESIIKRHSDFIAHPIKCEVERKEMERDEEGQIKPDGASKTVIEDRTFNAMKPIWTRPASEVTGDEYTDFYRHVAHDWMKPLKSLSLKAEGTLEYWALLFIPSQAPFDLHHGTSAFGLQLYAKQVMIMENCEDLLPPFLRFVKGVVDSADLPLNISRETLQQDRHITHIRKWLTGKIIKTLEELKRDEREQYEAFWKQFGRVLKEGVARESAQPERLHPLLLFDSSENRETMTSLAEYVERMKDDQEAIYYITGEDREVLLSSPHLEAFAARGCEVLLLTDPVDEIMVQNLTTFDEKPLRSAAKGEFDLGSGEEQKKVKEELDEKGKELSDVLEAVQKHLEEHVREVRLSNRLTNSPACLVGSEHDMSPQLERLMRGSQYQMPKQKRILELNPEHAIVVKLSDRFVKDNEDPKIEDVADMLLGFALIAEGSELHDVARFNQLLAATLDEAL
ncbi:MAG: molecular chaperone HtpG [bacterium]|nr:molecular chaperone HtpG [bacterium]